ncbi:MAG TPA: DUF3489 domain-containing protein [Bryobacteraceae bacterium]
MISKEVATGENNQPTAALAPGVETMKASQKKGSAKDPTKPARRKAAARTSKHGAVKKDTGQKPTATTQAKSSAPRTGSKGASVIEMMRRPKGATLAEIMKATGWQAHSVRGYISIASNKRGIKIESTKNQAGDRSYRITR